MEIKKKESHPIIMTDNIQTRFKKIKNTVINLKKVNYLYLLFYLSIFLSFYRVMNLFFYL